MFKKFNASPATQGASEAGGGASEKKRNQSNARKKRKDLRSAYHGVGYGIAALFIVVSAFASSSALYNIGAASIVYDNELLKAKQAIADDINADLDDNGNFIISDNTSDSNPINVDGNVDGNGGTNISINVDGGNGGNLYIDENGNIVACDKDGNKHTYYICTTCSKCGDMTSGDSKCPLCGSSYYKYKVYNVKRGDTLSKVSGEVGASVNSIANLNEIDNVNLIYEGESLRIPQ